MRLSDHPAQDLSGEVVRNQLKFLAKLQAGDSSIPWESCLVADPWFAGGICMYLLARLPWYAMIQVFHCHVLFSCSIPAGIPDYSNISWFRLATWLWFLPCWIAEGNDVTFASFFFGFWPAIWQSDRCICCILTWSNTVMIPVQFKTVRWQGNSLQSQSNILVSLTLLWADPKIWPNWLEHISFKGICIVSKPSYLLISLHQRNPGMIYPMDPARGMRPFT